MEKLEADKCETIYWAVRKALVLAIHKNALVELTFNEIKLFVTPVSYANDVVEIYNLKHELRMKR